MRVLTFAASALVLTAASGCAPTTGSNTYATETQRLSADCTARGGILTATGQVTGRPQLDNVCRITGGASRLNQPPTRGQ